MWKVRDIEKPSIPLKRRRRVTAYGDNSLCSSRDSKLLIIVTVMKYGDSMIRFLYDRFMASGLTTEWMSS